MAVSSLVLLLATVPTIIHGHGYLKTPRSRNLYAYLERDWEDSGGTSPYPEDCPHCLNRGGTRSQCGLLEGIDFNQLPWIRNYDAPLSSRGDRLPPEIQQTYTEGDTIEIEVMVTTHHKGHFVFSACPLIPLLDSDEYQKGDWGLPLKIPTEECFASHRLKFVSDELYGAPHDPEFPERAYIAPASVPQWSQGEGPGGPGTGVTGALYKMKFELPKGLNGEVVLIQWYYLTANSCKHEGYASYPFPPEWGSDVNNYAQMEDCGDVPPDGNGVPEQFWNCGEVKIERKSSTSKKDGPKFKESWYRDEADRGDVEDGQSVVPIGGPGTAAATTTDGYNDEAPISVEHNDPGMVVPDYSETISGEEVAQLISQGDFEAEVNIEHDVVEIIEEETPPTAPTGPCSDPKFSGYEATEDCSGYYYCQAGTIGEEYPCGQGTLYDSRKQMCTWADEVRCPGSMSAMLSPGETLPPVPPTPHPTQKPNALLDWDRSKKKRPHDKTIIGYYASWQWYDRDGLAAPANMDFSKITRANFAFFQITEDGYIYGTDSWADPITLFGFYDWMAEPGTGHEYCSWDGPNEEPVCNHHHYEEGLIYMAHQAGAEVYPSIGGWSLSDPFPTMAANAEYRANFVRQCIALIKNYNFDGIDIDWEYPGYEPHSGTPEDGVSWNLLLDDLRAALDELEEETGHYYGITAALPCGPSIIDNQDIAHVGKMLTELNLMTYDFHGTWNELVGVNAPLYDQEGEASEMMSVHGCVENWVNGGAPKEKINIGFPFYGRSFLGAKALYEEFGGAADESMWHEDEGCPQYYNIIKKFKGLTTSRDEQTMTQVAYSKSGALSYDDPRAICDKTEYAMDHGLNGYIIWELSGDILEDKSTPLLDAANKKLEDPSVDCSAMSDADALVSKQKDENAGPSYWYPVYDGSTSCADDGNQPSYLKLSDLFENEKDCCDKHFSWASDCVSQGSTTDNEDGGKKKPSLYYPKFDGAGICVNDGNQPSYYVETDMFHNAENCCEKHFSWNADCFKDSFVPNTESSSTVAATEAYPFERPEANAGLSHVVNFSPNIHDKNEAAKVEATLTTSTAAAMAVTDEPTTTTVVPTTTTTDVDTTSTSQIYTEPAIETSGTHSTTDHRTTEVTTTDLPTETTTDLTSTSSTTSDEMTTTNIKHTDPTIETTTTTTTTPAKSTTTTTTTPSRTTTTTTSKQSAVIAGSSHADGFVSSSQQFASFVHSKDSDKKPEVSSEKPEEEPKESYASSISASISQALNHKKDEDEQEAPKAQSNEAKTDEVAPENNPSDAEYRLYIGAFSVDLLPFKSGHSLEVRNPQQMAKAVAKYLLSYFHSLDNQSFTKKLIDFDLECGRSKEKFGSDVNLVLNCSGDAIFNAWPPSKQQFTDLIEEAFGGSNRGKFLEFMYPTYEHSSARESTNEIEANPNKNESSSIANAYKDKLKSSLQAKLDELFSPDTEKDRDVNEVKQAKKNAIQMKRMSQTPGERRLLRSRT